ncbi:condensation domain-containing protein, partial [Microbulbifer epialgicus]
TPIIQWLLDQEGAFDHFSQSMLLRVPALREAPLTAALQDLLDHHHALRLRLNADDSLEIAPAGSVSAAGCLRRVALHGLDKEARAQELQRETSAAQSRLAPGAGQMLQGVWFDDDGESRLLLVIHHLVVDGVSWRILVPDLQAAYNARERGEASALEPVPTSFREWALALPAAAAQRRAEIPFWQSMSAGVDPLLTPRPLDPSRDTVATRRELSLRLETDVTRILLTRAPERIHGRINDVL